MKYSIFLHAILIVWMGTTSIPLSFSGKSKSLPPNSAQAECKDITLNLDINGQAALSTADIDDGSTGFGTLIFSLSDTAFDCSDRGVQTVTLVVSDTSSSDNCTAQVTINDMISPNPICKNIILELDSTGEATISPSDVNDGSSDACGIMQLSLDRDDFTCTDISPFSKVVNLSVMDSSQNIANCQALVMIADILAPDVRCQNVTLELDDFGGVKIDVSDIDASSSDNCGIASLVIDRDSFACSDISPFNKVVTLQAIDIYGNDNSCQALIMVVDAKAPEAKCKDITVYLDAYGADTLSVQDIDEGSSDNCGISSKTIPPTIYSCASVGMNPSTILKVIDNYGNHDSCDAVVTVLDTLAPDAVCQDITVFLDANGRYSLAASEVEAGSIDNCGIDDIHIPSTQFDCTSTAASTLITLTLTDIHGNVDSCKALITILDTLAPDAQCQPVTVYLDATGSYVLSATEIESGSSDNCGIASIMIPPSSFDCNSVASPIQLTVTDVNGNQDKCLAQIVIQDTISPDAQCQPVTVYLDATGSYVLSATEIENGSSDNCGIASIMIPPSSFDCNSVASPIQLTVTDVNGNQDKCLAQIVIQDTISPDAQCQPVTVYLDVTGSYVLSATEIESGSSDNCGIASIMIPPSSFDCNSVASPIQLTVTDVNGNQDKCLAQIVIQDTLLPDAQCKPVTVYLDAMGDYTLVSATINNNSIDNCGATQLSLSINQSNFDCSHVGANTIDLTITDASNNSASCQANVTVIDSTSPDVICQNLTIQLNSMGLATILPNDIDNGSDDACGIQTLDISKNAFDCTDLLNSTQNLTLTVTDVNNNTSTCQAVILIQDTIGPVVTCTQITVFLDNLGQASIQANDVGVALDNCEVKGIAIDQSNFDCSHLGMNVIIFAAEDSSGNLSSCNPQVEVRDTLSPIITCPIDEVVPADANCQAILTDFTNQVTPTDNCTSLPTVNQFPAISTLLADTTVITLRATDGSNNASSCTFRFIVIDETAPAVACKDIIVTLDSTGFATIDPDDVTDTKMDNCTPLNDLQTSINKDTFNCTELATLAFTTLTVRDARDNVDSCRAIITVIDEIFPEVQCPDSLEIELGNADQLLNHIITSDNCGVSDIAFSISDITCAMVAQYVPITISVEDESKNITPCTITVFVKDTALAAWLTRPANIIRCGEQLIDWDEPTARFPCDRTPLVNYTSEPAGLVKEGAFPIGTTQIFYQLEDVLVKKTLENDFQIEILPIPIITNYTTGDEFIATSQEDFEILPEADVPGVSYLWELQLSEYLQANPALPASLTSGPLVQTFSFTDARSVGEARYRITPVFADSCVGESVEILVKVRPGTGTFFVPEMFTPNGDGFNDDWGVQLLKAGSPDDFRVMVFNQAGGRMFSSLTLNNRWAGGNCPDGPYWYVIERRDTGERVKTGGVTIQR